MPNKTKPVKGPVNEAMLAELLDRICATDGAEIPGSEWALAEVLVSRGQITLSAARGPGGYWRRATPAGTQVREHPAPPWRWQQFERSVLAHLRAARESLALAQGLAMSDGLIKWSGDARELAARVHVLVKEIEENRDRMLQESISGPMPEGQR